MFSFISFLEVGALELLSRIMVCILGDTWKWGGRNGELPVNVKGYEVSMCKMGEF